MRVSLIIFLIFGGFLFTSPTTAQPDAPQLYLHIITSDQHYTPDSAFIDTVVNALNQIEIDVVLIDTPETYDEHIGFWYQPTVVLTMRELPAGTQVSVSPYTSLPWPLDPIAVAIHDVGLDFILTDDNISTLDATLAGLLGIATYVLGDCGSSMRYLSKVEVYPSVFRTSAREAANFYLGNCALLTEDYETAETYYAEVIELNTMRPQLYARINLAWARSHMDGNPTYVEGLATLIDVYSGTDAVSPYNDAILWSRYAYALAQDNQFDAAIEAIDTAIALRSDASALYVIRGQIHLAIYEWDSALLDYQNAIYTDFNDPSPYYFRGILHYSILQTGVSTREDALNDFKMYLQMAPHGLYADEATAYAESIQAELQALDE